MPRATLGTHEQMHQRAKKKLELIIQIVFIKQLMAQGAHQTLYKGILLLQIEKYKIAPKAIQYICGYLDTTQCPTASKYPVFLNQHKDGRKRLSLTSYHVKNVSCFKKFCSDLAARNLYKHILSSMEVFQTLLFPGLMNRFRKIKYYP